MPLEIEIGLLNVTPPMQDADNLNPIRDRAVEGKIFTDHDTSDTCSNIVPRNTYARLGRDESPSFFYPIKQPVGSAGIFHRDAGPDFDEVFFSLRPS
jgi:hypothetical protein